METLRAIKTCHLDVCFVMNQILDDFKAAFLGRFFVNFKNTYEIATFNLV